MTNTETGNYVENAPGKIQLNVYALSSLYLVLNLITFKVSKEGKHVMSKSHQKNPLGLSDNDINQVFCLKATAFDYPSRYFRIFFSACTHV